MRSRASQIWESVPSRLKVKMHVRGLIRATLGFVGFCLVAFVQQSASGSKATQGKFSPQIYLLRKPLLIFLSALWRSFKAGGDDASDQRWYLWICIYKKSLFVNTILQVLLYFLQMSCFAVSECSVEDRKRDSYLFSTGFFFLNMYLIFIEHL